MRHVGCLDNFLIGVQGFDENMMAMLKQQYPARLMPQLVQSSQDTLQVLLLCLLLCRWIGRLAQTIS